MRERTGQVNSLGVKLRRAAHPLRGTTWTAHDGVGTGLLLVRAYDAPDPGLSTLRHPSAHRPLRVHTDADLPAGPNPWRRGVR